MDSWKKGIKWEYSHFMPFFPFFLVDRCNVGIQMISLQIAGWIPNTCFLFFLFSTCNTLNMQYVPINRFKSTKYIIKFSHHQLSNRTQENSTAKPRNTAVKTSYQPNRHKNINNPLFANIQLISTAQTLNRQSKHPM